MQAQMDALALARHGTSLLKLGYENVVRRSASLCVRWLLADGALRCCWQGLDDCWQSCTGSGGSFHDPTTGQPLINTTLFPSLGGMVEHGHNIGVKVGFYQDNCRCHECKDRETCWGQDTHYAQDANLTESLKFDGLKVDSCGNQRDMTQWAAEFAKPGNHDLMVESCGNGPEGTSPKKAEYTGADYLGLAPTWKAMLEDTCPFSFYRVSVDVAPQFLSTVFNLNRALPYLRPEAPLSRPGCWACASPPPPPPPRVLLCLSRRSCALCLTVRCCCVAADPDMLETGVAPMTYTESQTHFAMWAVTSAPLILGFDLHDSEVVEANWKIIANEEVLNVSQTYAGHPGYLVKNSSEYFVGDVKHGCTATRGENQSLPEYQVWAKPQPGGKLAVLVVNIGVSAGLTVTLPLAELYHEGLFTEGAPAKVQIRDLWKHTEVHPGTEWTELVVEDVAQHDGMFVLLTPA